MSITKLSDREAKDILMKWPERPTRLFKLDTERTYWLRAQPPDGVTTGPRLVMPGSHEFSTQPDGLYVWIEGDLKFADVIAIEVCGVGQNLNDKRSRYMPTTHALLLECGKSWLDGEITIQRGRKTPRWKATGTISESPIGDVRVPVRHIRVLYALPDDLYKDWKKMMTFGAHEFLCLHSALELHTNAAYREFLTRMAPGSQAFGEDEKQQGKQKKR